MISIDGYADIERIGQGGLGDVYRATQLSTGGTVAVKVLRDISDESVAWHRTRRELTALVSLAGHANVIQLLEVLDLAEGPALVMEYAPGGSVADLMARRQQPLSVGETAFVGRQTATALIAAHERDIVHRDVKPQNLLIDAYGQVKLCDFGIAAMARSDEFQDRTNAISMRYASPEDLDDEVDVGPASDIYSLGATMLHLARGAPPTLKERLAPWQPPRSDDVGLATLDGVVAACLHPTPARRPSAADVADELERLGWETDERNRAIAFESIGLVEGDDRSASDQPTGPACEPTGAVTAMVAALAAETGVEHEQTVLRAAASDDEVDPSSQSDVPRPAPSSRRRPWLIAGLLVASVLVLGIVALIVWPSDDGGSSVEIVDRPSDLVDIREIDWPLGDVGECLVQNVDGLGSAPCSGPHDLQRFSVGELSPELGTFDAEAVEAAARTLCNSAFGSFVGITVDASEFQVAIGAPSVTSWTDDDDRTYQCLLGVAGRRVVGDAEASRH